MDARMTPRRPSLTTGTKRPRTCTSDRYQNRPDLYQNRGIGTNRRLVTARSGLPRWYRSAPLVQVWYRLQTQPIPALTRENKPVGTDWYRFPELNEYTKKQAHVYAYALFR